jgi:hypothetical protein
MWQTGYSSTSRQGYIVTEFEQDFYKAIDDGDTLFWYLSPDGPRLVRHSAQHTASEQETLTLDSNLQGSSTTAVTDQIPEDIHDFMSALRLGSPKFIPRDTILGVSASSSRKQRLTDVFIVEPGLRQIGLKIFRRSLLGLRKWR